MAAPRPLPAPIAWACLALLLLLLASHTLPTVMAAPRSRRTTTTVTTTNARSSGTASAVCPKSPMCSRRGAPSTFRFRYCNPLTSRLLSLFTTVARRPSRDELPFDQDDALRAHVLREAEQLLGSRLIGQSHIRAPLVEALRRKLQYPSEPLVLHLAGDNGVGKTHTARLLSLALSLRCSPDRELCDAGDNLLTISGTSFDSLTTVAARRVIVGRVLQHMRTHPHGIVLIDDLTAMDPALVPILAPLLGRAAYYPEQFLPEHDEDGAGEAVAAARPRTAPDPPSSLGGLLVILTTDLGQQGRTVGQSIARIDQMVRDGFAELYGTLLPAYTRTFAYVPFTTEVAAEVVRAAVVNLPCTIGEQAAGAGGPIQLLSPTHHTQATVVASSIDEMAVLLLVERHRPAWEGKENGHALRRAVEDELVAQVLAYQLEQGMDHRLVVRFVVDEASMSVVLSTGRGTGGFVYDAQEDEDTAVDKELGEDL